MKPKVQNDTIRDKAYVQTKAMNRNVGTHDPYHVQPHVMSPRYDHLTTDPDSRSRLRKTRLAVRSSAPRTFDDNKPQRPTCDNRSDGKGYCPPPVTYNGGEELSSPSNIDMTTVRSPAPRHQQMHPTTLMTTNLSNGRFDHLDKNP